MALENVKGRIHFGLSAFAPVSWSFILHQSNKELDKQLHDGIAFSQESPGFYNWVQSKKINKLMK